MQLARWTLHGIYTIWCNILGEGVKTVFHPLTRDAHAHLINCYPLINLRILYIIFMQSKGENAIHRRMRFSVKQYIYIYTGIGYMYIMCIWNVEFNVLGFFLFALKRPEYNVRKMNKTKFILTKIRIHRNKGVGLMEHWLWSTARVQLF